MIRNYIKILLLALIGTGSICALIGDVVRDTAAGAANIAGEAVATAGNVTADVVGSPSYRGDQVSFERGLVADDVVAPVEQSDVLQSSEDELQRPDLVSSSEEPMIVGRRGRNSDYRRNRRYPYRGDDQGRHTFDPHSNVMTKLPARN